MSTSRLVVPDTSVLAKWLLHHELHADKALLIREAYMAGAVLLAIPTLALYELTNILERAEGISTEVARRFFALVTELGLAVVPPDASDLAAALELARATGLSTYDAAFLQLALEAGGTWVTADDRALQRLPLEMPATALASWAPPQ